MQRGSYTFGDSDLAAERLALVAEVFDAPSRRFLGEARAALTESPSLAVDLGCGPGRTTRLVAELTGAARTVGIDASASFLAEATRLSGGDGIEFVEHDVTSVPFPVGPADLVYCRLLLAHLPEPAAIVDRWMTQVRPGGVLAVDEVEFIDTPHPVLARYEELVVALVASRGALMYAGPVIDAMPDGDGWQREATTLIEHLVPVALAARMYGMNFRTWRDDPAITANCSQEDLDQLAADLAELAAPEAHGGDPPVRWGLRQALIRRTGQTTQSAKGDNR
ncbi:MAG: class I SAM-dependent methyltransferase [Actinobacteria bacterium]|nr:class I SAM-dependent methyltransferase [Actinomycetota bacterium]